MESIAQKGLGFVGLGRVQWKNRIQGTAGGTDRSGVSSGEFAFDCFIFLSKLESKFISWERDAGDDVWGLRIEEAWSHHQGEWEMIKRGEFNI